jgi:hypothetical protein
MLGLVEQQQQELAARQLELITQYLRNGRPFKEARAPMDPLELPQHPPVHLWLA